MTEFSIYCLAASLIFNFIGIQFKFFPPKKLTWMGPGVRIHSALRNIDTWKEANNYIAFPAFVTGSIFIFISILPEIVNTTFFNSQKAIILFSFALLAIYLLTHRHINKTFDKNGNRKI